MATVQIGDDVARIREQFNGARAEVGKVLVGAGFSRIQFTPDMLPSDVTGTQIFKPTDGTYSVKKGPVFGNLILADGTRG